MPIPFVSKVAGEKGTSVGHQEDLWAKAKEQVSKSYPGIDHDSDRAYALTTTVYKSMAHAREAVLAKQARAAELACPNCTSKDCTTATVEGESFDTCNTCGATAKDFIEERRQKRTVTVINATMKPWDKKHGHVSRSNITRPVRALRPFAAAEDAENLEEGPLNPKSPYKRGTHEDDSFRYGYHNAMASRLRYNHHADSEKHSSKSQNHMHVLDGGGPHPEALAAGEAEGRKSFLNRTVKAEDQGNIHGPLPKHTAAPVATKRSELDQKATEHGYSPSLRHVGHFIKTSQHGTTRRTVTLSTTPKGVSVTTHHAQAHDKNAHYDPVARWHIPKRSKVHKTVDAAIAHAEQEHHALHIEDIEDDGLDVFIEATTSPAPLKGAMMSSFASLGTHPVVNHIHAGADGSSILHFKFLTKDDATRALSHVMNPGDLGTNHSDQLHVRTMDGKSSFAHRVMSPLEAAELTGATDPDDADGDVFVESAATDHRAILTNLKNSGHHPIAHQVVDTGIGHHNAPAVQAHPFPVHGPNVHGAQVGYKPAHVSHFQFGSKAAATRARQHLLSTGIPKKSIITRASAHDGTVKVKHSLLTASEARELIGETNWLKDVQPKWKPAEGLFGKSGEEIAKTLIEAGKFHAARRLAAYMSHAERLDPDALGRLNRAKALIAKSAEGVQHESANPAIGLAAGAVRVIG